MLGVGGSDPVGSCEVFSERHFHRLHLQVVELHSGIDDLIRPKHPRPTHIQQQHNNDRQHHQRRYHQQEDSRVGGWVIAVAIDTGGER